jgi:type II secretory pathway pseudopilin PulG
MTSVKLHKNKQSEVGFTLVELAIVMIIIGLLIGGILKGQELVGNARVTATVAQVKGIDGAISTFRDKYSAMPGDMQTPATRLANCAAGTPCGRAGTGNGRIDSPAVIGNAFNQNQEAATSFVHMAAADLISGVQNVAVPQFGQMVPEAEIGGGFRLGYTANGSARLVPANRMRSGHYLILSGVNETITSTTIGLTPIQAAQIDRKLDDGVPTTGGVQTVGTGCAAGAVYNEATEVSQCNMYIRVQS